MTIGASTPPPPPLDNLTPEPSPLEGVEESVSNVHSMQSIALVSGKLIEKLVICLDQ